MLVVVFSALIGSGELWSSILVLFGIFLTLDFANDDFYKQFTCAYRSAMDSDSIMV